ncbi:MAG TPA: helix-turn-helix transcriptional regulator [Azonexus sp.]|nr:helix-turn-helix transcriptional regulator [Azonexus sp.]
MDITKRVAHNLSAWMDGHETLGTLKLVAAAANVGFGTVRRAKNGDGNITVQNLDAIAKVFKKTAADLIAEPKQATAQQANETPALYLADEAHRIPARLAKLTDEELDKLLAVLNLVETMAVGQTATPLKSSTPGWSELPAGNPEKPAAKASNQGKQGQ